MKREVTIGTTRVATIKGDITQQDTDAIVNAANSSLMGGGGVDGAIHRTGGPEILAECKKIVAEIGRLPTGEAVITTGGNLKAPYVIHTVGPIWHGGDRREPDLLASAYKNSLRIALFNKLRTISFPSISTGAYRFPIDRAASIAVTTVADFAAARENQLDEIRFVLFSDTDYKTYSTTLMKLT